MGTEKKKKILHSIKSNQKENTDKLIVLPKKVRKIWLRLKGKLWYKKRLLGAKVNKNT